MIPETDHATVLASLPSLTAFWRRGVEAGRYTAAHALAEQTADLYARRGTVSLVQVLAALTACGCRNCRAQAGEFHRPRAERCHDCARTVRREGSDYSSGVRSEVDGATRCRRCHRTSHAW